MNAEAVMIIDEEYIKVRNGLIPAAERYANHRHGVRFNGSGKAEREVYAAAWNHTFHKRMNQLYATTLISCPTCGGKGYV